MMGGRDGLLSYPLPTLSSCCTGADDASGIVLLFLYSYKVFLSPRGRSISVLGVVLQD